jgi:2-methylaconitate cis-trans-isomerase PrpF
VWDDGLVYGVAGVGVWLDGDGVVHDVARPQAHATGSYRIGHPGGTLTAAARVAQTTAGVTVVRASLTRTARRIFAGTIFAELSRVREFGRE